MGCFLVSYLMRNGTGRNNIVFGGSASTNGQYLRRTSTGRNNIQWYSINNTNTTINILERYNNTRNGIRYSNVAFYFSGDLTKIHYTSIRFNGHGESWNAVFNSGAVDMIGFTVTNVTRNTITRSSTANRGALSISDHPYTYYIGFICSTQSYANIAAQELSKFSKIVYSGLDGSQTVNIKGNYKTVFYQHHGDYGNYDANVYLGVVECDNKFSMSRYYTFTFS